MVIAREITSSQSHKQFLFQHYASYLILIANITNDNEFSLKYFKNI